MHNYDKLITVLDNLFLRYLKYLNLNLSLLHKVICIILIMKSDDLIIFCMALEDF